MKARRRARATTRRKSVARKSPKKRMHRRTNSFNVARWLMKWCSMFFSLKHTSKRYAKKASTKRKSVKRGAPKRAHSRRKTSKTATKRKTSRRKAA